MRNFIIALFTFIMSSAYAQKHELAKVWETEPVLAIPESVFPDLKNNILYVSLINGSPWEADGKGGIAKLSPEGKIIDSVWVSGLNAPKGMGMLGNMLYIADITDVVVVDTKTGKIAARINVSGAKGLNDISVAKSGAIYVSDSFTGKVYRIQDKQASLYLENLSSINGLKAVNNDLYILASPFLYKADASKKLTKILEGLEKGADGIEPLKNGDFIVSCWGGLVYYVTKDGKKQLLLDTQAEKMNTADIGLDPTKNTVYIPTFFKKTVAAYQVK